MSSWNARCRPRSRSIGSCISRSNGRGKRRTCRSVLRQGKVLSAVYRVGPYKSSTGTPQGYALRLLVEPKRAPLPSRRTHDEALALAN